MIRLADQARGSNKYPHWHDSPAWARQTTMTRSRFLSMSAKEFADWCLQERDDAMAFFYGSRWPEGFTYCTNRNWTMATAYPGLKKWRQNWPTVLLDTEN